MRTPFTTKKEPAKHERWMELALALAHKGVGLTRPNPPVGAVIVRNGRLIASGFHKRAGAGHAEVIALKKASEKAKDASLYVTLEPCSSFGKTPPCVNAIIKSGIREVIVATRDPNPRHQGRGLFALKKAGLKVIEGVCRNEAQILIEPFKKWILTGRPYVSLKLAVSLDGKIADRLGHSRWITGTRSREEVQALRRRVDAILVGAGTIIADDPSLLPRPPKGRHIYRIVLDARGCIPPGAQILRDDSRHQTIIVTSRTCPPKTIHAWEKANVQVWILPSQNGRIAIPPLMVKIGQMGLLHVLCEGGSEVADSLVREKTVDEFVFFVAPCLIGGHNALSAFGGNGWLLKNAPRLTFTECRFIGKDILIRAKPEDYHWLHWRHGYGSF